MSIKETLEFLEGKPINPLGELIRRKRRQIGLTQEELAEKAGISQNYVAKIETGISNIGPKALTKLAIALDIPSDELIEFNLGYFEGIANLIDKRIDYNNEFHELPTRLKELLLKLAPIIEKYI